MYRFTTAGFSMSSCAGHADNSEIRVHRGGMAALSAMFSRAFVQDLRQARKNGGYPTVDDPARATRQPPAGPCPGSPSLGA